MRSAHGFIALELCFTFAFWLRTGLVSLSEKSSFTELGLYSATAAAVEAEVFRACASSVAAFPRTVSDYWVSCFVSQCADFTCLCMGSRLRLQN